MEFFYTLSQKSGMPLGELKKDDPKELPLTIEAQIEVIENELNKLKEMLVLTDKL